MHHQEIKDGIEIARLAAHQVAQLPLHGIDHIVWQALFKKANDGRFKGWTSAHSRKVVAAGYRLVSHHVSDHTHEPLGAVGSFAAAADEYSLRFAGNSFQQGD